MIPDPLEVLFSGGVNLAELPSTAVFNALNTGHSAQFLHSYQAAGAYWRKLAEDTK